MKRGWLLNLTMLTAVAMLAWFAWRTPSRDEAARDSVTAVNPAAVSSISLTRHNQPPIKLERKGEHWWITAPLNARADEFQVLRMLTILEAQPTARLPAADRTRFELDQPAAVLDIDGVQYAFGAINTVTREQYVQRGDTIHAVDLRHGAGLPANAVALIRRALLSETEQPVTIELPEFTISKNNGQWKLLPASVEIGADDLQRYVDHWRVASAASAEPYDNRPVRADIRITLSDGKTVSFGVLQREPQLVLWRRDNGLQYTFLGVAGRVLLTNPARRAVEK